MGDTQRFALSRGHSATYHHFLGRDLSGYPAIRRQVTGPVSFGFRVMDENQKPIIYNEGVSPIKAPQVGSIEETLVERALAILKQLSQILREGFALSAQDK